MQKVEFIIHNLENCGTEKNPELMKLPKIIINGKNGSIALNSACLKILNLKNDDKVYFVQNRNRLQDWFITTTHAMNPLGFKVKINYKKGTLVINNITISNTVLARRIITSLEPAEKMNHIFSIPIGDEFIQDDKKYFGLVTAKRVEKKP